MYGDEEEVPAYSLLVLNAETVSYLYIIVPELVYEYGNGINGVLSLSSHFHCFSGFCSAVHCACADHSPAGTPVLPPGYPGSPRPGAFLLPAVRTLRMRGPGRRGRLLKMESLGRGDGGRGGPVLLATRGGGGGGGGDRGDRGRQRPNSRRRGQDSRPRPQYNNRPRVKNNILMLCCINLLM